MKRLLALMALVFFAFILPAGAQSPDDQYVLIYNLIQQADAVNNADQPAEALPKFLEAQSDLQKLQKLYPDWHVKVVNFRLNYLAAKIAAVTGKVPIVTVSTNAPRQPVAKPASASQTQEKPTELERQLAAFQDEVRLLQADKTLLEAKLKEALATQPATVDPRELTKAQERIQSLMKENDLLKASLAPDQINPTTGTAPRTLEEAKKALAAANRELAAQSQRANSLAAEKQTLQERLENAKSNDELAANLDTTKKALAEASHKLAEQTESAGKLALEKEALQMRVRALTTSAESADALRAENELLKKQVADLKSAAPASGDLARQLAQAQGQIAALQSDAEILRLEKIALQNRVKQMNTSGSAAVVRSPNLPEDAEHIKQLERERDDLLKKLEAANKELYGRKGKELGARIDELSGDIATLRARLEIFEARAVPYSAEELALFKPTAIQLASVDPNAGKKPIKELPADARSLVAEAQRHFSAREFDKAEEKYLEVLRRDDRNVNTLANLAAIQLELNHLDEAEKHLQQALAQSPEDAYVLLRLGDLKFRQEKYDEALDVLSRAAKLDPQNPEIQNFLGVTLSHKGMRGPAESALRRAIQIDPRYGDAHNNLAVIYASQQPPLVELARWHYQKALAAGHPHNAELEKMLDQKSAGEVK